VYAPSSRITTHTILRFSFHYCLRDDVQPINLSDESMQSMYIFPQGALHATHSGILSGAMVNIRKKGCNTARRFYSLQFHSALKFMHHISVSL